MLKPPCGAPCSTRDMGLLRASLGNEYRYIRDKQEQGRLTSMLAPCSGMETEWHAAQEHAECGQFTIDPFLCGCIRVKTTGVA